jgi:hypothetical protein
MGDIPNDVNLCIYIIAFYSYFNLSGEENCAVNFAIWGAPIFRQHHATVNPHLWWLNLKCLLMNPMSNMAKTIHHPLSTSIMVGPKGENKQTTQFD